ncbi:lactococcin 972 family bacteriocin [Bacillus sp. FSL R12-0074]|uniref:lactococcin 972 family bacteriocin n=1 Tax=Bacillus sp. FSL R12-0074 TaxID=2954664 RepID=UPI000D30A370
MSRKGFLGKGILSLGLCGALLASPVTSFAAEENNSTGPQMIYTEEGFTNLESGEQRVIQGKATPRVGSGQCFDNIEGGKWCKGQTMGWKLDWAQFSQYDHAKRTHKASAMANGVTNRGDWVKAGKQAYKTSNYYDKLTSYKSYYDVQ